MALTTAEKIVEVETAIHQIVSGQQVRVFVDQNGERVEFQTTNIQRLRAYYAELLALQSGSSRSPGPIGFYY